MRKLFRNVGAFALGCVTGVAGYALDGGNPVFITVPSGVSSGWKTFEIVSGEDALGALAVEGFDWSDGNYDSWDGLGAHVLDADTLRVYVNHESGAGSSFSRVDLNVPNLEGWIASGIADNTNTNQVSPPGPVVEAFSRGWLTVGSGTNPINNPCSGNVWLAGTFGPGRGFADDLYLTGEEVFGAGNGHFWVMDLATRTLYEAVDLGQGSWENATPVDTGRTDTVAVFLSEDLGSASSGNAPLRLYVGLKQPSGGFLARNGLVGGTVYEWNPDGGSTNATTGGIFSGGNGTVVSGQWQASSAGSGQFSKMEDVHVNVDKDSGGYGVEVALACQGEAVFLIDLSGLEYVAGALGTERTGTVRVLYEAGTQAGSNTFASMDNLVWSADGNIYVNEDDGEGDIWLIDREALEAAYGDGDFTPSAAHVYDLLDADGVGESSGIIDISDALGYVPGSIFLTSGQSGTTRNNQLAMAVAPGAEKRSAVYDAWVLGYPSLDTPVKRLRDADPDGDGLKNNAEFALGLAPDLPDSAGIPSLQQTPEGIEVVFNPARSLDLVDYRVDASASLAEPFEPYAIVEAAHVGESGEARVSLPDGTEAYVRLRVTVP